MKWQNTHGNGIRRIAEKTNEKQNKKLICEHTESYDGRNGLAGPE